MDARTPRDRHRRPPPLARGTDEARRLIRQAQLALAAAALAAAVTVAMIVAEQQYSQQQYAALIPVGTAGPLATGALAGLTTLLACWGVLAVGGGVWRSRLAARDRLDWTAEWARVEPHWSGRQR